MEQEAFQNYLNSYLEICPELEKEELEYIRRNLTLTSLRKKGFYLKSGQIQNNMGFVHQGLLRSYYIDESGKKVTISFIHENSYAADYPSFIQQKPSKYYIEAIEPTTMVNLPYVAIQGAYSEYKNFEKYGRLIAEQILLKKQDRIESFLFENAEKRYTDFIQKNQNIITRISISDLSSYLGIERQSLTRIRKKMVENHF